MFKSCIGDRHAKCNNCFKDFEGEYCPLYFCDYRGAYTADELAYIKYMEKKIEDEFKLKGYIVNEIIFEKIALIIRIYGCYDFDDDYAVFEYLPNEYFEIEHYRFCDNDCSDSKECKHNKPCYLSGNDYELSKDETIFAYKEYCQTIEQLEELANDVLYWIKNDLLENNLKTYHSKITSARI